jgi:probable phosphoglycerate mutase
MGNDSKPGRGISKMRLFIVRHGETEWNVEGRFQGKRDTSLSERGRRQGELVAEYLSGHTFEAVVSSPPKRALDTGRLIAAACGCEKLEVLDELAEICHGDWESLLADDVKNRWPGLVAAWHELPHTVVMPGAGGESLRSVQIRALSAVERMKGEYSSDICVTTHDAVIKALLCNFLNASLSAYWHYQIANCSLTIAELKDSAPPRVSLMGDAHYLGVGFELPEQKGL